MNANRKQHYGFSMVELLVVLAILAVLAGLILPAVWHARQSAIRAESMNNVRQLALGVHGYATCNNGRLPSIPTNIQYLNGDATGFILIEPGLSLHLSILPFLNSNEAAGVSLFISPADPTAEQAGSLALCSYPSNARAFQYAVVFPKSFTDGTSCTILFAEHYSLCGQYRFSFAYNEVHWPWSMDQNTWVSRRATFADEKDAIPYTTGKPPRSVDSAGLGVTFQSAPSLDKCDPSLAQTPHSGGMIVATADGSVRILSPGISPQTYWALVTPAGGEILGNDWD